MAKDRFLVKLAETHGVLTSYVDMRKRRIEASDESIRLALHSLGALNTPDSDVQRALRIRERETANGVIEPVFVAWDGRLPQAALSHSKRATLVLEDGTTLPLPIKQNLPHGYHRLIIQEHRQTTESLVISAPQKANFPFSENTWGVFGPVYSLHSKRSRGAGDLTDLQSLGDWMQSLNGKVISTLPLLANYLDEPFEPSPYSPISRLFWNEFYIDPERVPEFAAARTTINQDPLPRRGTQYVQYGEVMAAKRSVLEHMAKQFFSNRPTARYDEFTRFVSAGPEVSQYARFRSVTDRQRRGWHEWPERLRKGAIRKNDFEEGTYQYHLYVQWVVQDQLQQLSATTRHSGAMLYLDLPLGLHVESFDQWQYPDFFVKGMAGGAPPDPVFTTGQNWAFPPIHPQAMRRDQYRYTIAYIRNHLRFARLLRIDHVMGLHRLYWIPQSLTGDKGLYVKYPAEEMYAILSLESHRYSAGIVGENLGVVPPEVNRSLARHNIRPLYIVQAETAVNTDRSVLRPPPAGSVASLNTHDMFPFRAFLDGSDIGNRVRLKFLSQSEAAVERKDRGLVRRALAHFVAKGKSSPEKILLGCYEFLGKSKAGIVLVNLEDLWQETKPQNIPATTTERPNWRRRLRYSMERLRRDKALTTILRTLDRARLKKPSN